MSTLADKNIIVKESYEAVSRLRLVFDFVLKPYLNRVKMGEGGLFLLNVVHSIFAYRNNIGLIGIETMLSFMVMCAMYGFNDYCDRYNDIANTKKEKKFSLAIIHNERFFILVNLLLTSASLVLAFFFLEFYKALVLAILFAVSCIYSYKLKSFPLLDIIIVALWGGLYVMLAGKYSLSIACIAGLMTAIAHLFQMMTDKDSDVQREIKTTIVAMPGREMLFLGALCAALGIFLLKSVTPAWALSCVIPVLIYGISGRIALSWHLSRLYFIICWLQLINMTYGGF